VGTVEVAACVATGAVVAAGAAGAVVAAGAAGAVVAAGAAGAVVAAGATGAVVAAAGAHAESTTDSIRKAETTSIILRILYFSFLKILVRFHYRLPTIFWVASDIHPRHLLSAACMRNLRKSAQSILSLKTDSEFADADAELFRSMFLPPSRLHAGLAGERLSTVLTSFRASTSPS
jgi:hypothetical protein